MFHIVKKNNSDSRQLRLYIKRLKCSIKVCGRKTYMFKIDYCNYKIFLLKRFLLSCKYCVSKVLLCQWCPHMMVSVNSLQCFWNSWICSMSGSLQRYWMCTEAALLVYICGGVQHNYNLACSAFFSVVLYINYGKCDQLGVSFLFDLQTKKEKISPNLIQKFNLITS